MRYLASLSIVEILLICCPHAQAGDQIKPKDKPGNAMNWIRSKDGAVGLHLHPKIESMTRNDGFVMVALVRNFSDKPIYVFKPFSGPLVGMPPAIRGMWSIRHSRLRVGSESEASASAASAMVRTGVGESMAASVAIIGGYNPVFEPHAATNVAIALMVAEKGGCGELKSRVVSATGVEAANQDAKRRCETNIA